MRPALPIAAMAFLLAIPVLAQQQENSAPPAAQKNSAAKKQDQQPTSNQHKPAAQENPFPQEQSEKAARQAQQQQNQSVPDQPQPHAGSSTANQNPFPEEKSEKAAHQAQQQSSEAQKSAPAGQDGSSSHVKGLDLGDLGGSASSDGAGGTVLSPELGRKDTKVGNFYLHSGDYKGAYDRFAEATKVDPTNADAVFGLAEAARRLNRRAEAVSNYQLYLSAVPDGEHAKDARRALKELGAAPRS